MRVNFGMKKRPTSVVGGTRVEESKFWKYKKRPTWAFEKVVITFEKTNGLRAHFTFNQLKQKHKQALSTHRVNPTCFNLHHRLTAGFVQLPRPPVLNQSDGALDVGYMQ